MKPPEPSISDAECVAASRRGDQKAFGQLIQRYQALVYRFLFHFTGNASDAEDLTQETFLNLYRKLDLHDPKRKFSAWLLTMARNLAVSQHRRRTPTPLAPEIVAEAIRDVLPSPESSAVWNETANELHLTIQKLPDDLREAVIFRYLLDLQINEIAVLLELPEGTVKSRVFKARQELRDALARLERTPTRA
ncbi:MAG TPA: sigma-70 family RNA polymerase sigma factor [Candidatus Ozemobacteraceae bacterium]|nr:sigma-70 family RNA polymerase sigma factor [Candidatus Ozemobacteraceae bacterium]